MNEKPNLKDVIAPLTEFGEPYTVVCEVCGRVGEGVKLRPDAEPSRRCPDCREGQ